MGVKGLLPLLRPISVDRNLDHFSGQTAGIDGYVWLHRAAYHHSTYLVMASEAGVPNPDGTAKKSTKKSDNGDTSTIEIEKPPDSVIRIRLEQLWRTMAQTFLKYCKMLQNYDVTPYIVFDGGFLPTKGAEEESRQSTRKEKRIAGLEFLNLGDRSTAHQCFAAAVDVIPEMAMAVCKQLKLHNIKYVVAPYEADAQLAYLSRTKQVDFIITEDSDMLPYGVESVLFKLDLSTGNGQHMQLRRDWNQMGGGDAQQVSHLGKVLMGGLGCESDLNSADNNVNTNLDTQSQINSTVTTKLTGTDLEESRRTNAAMDRFLAVCILLGTDYYSHITTIPKAGPKKVCEIVARVGANPEKILKRARLEGYEVPEGFVEYFWKAWMCFRHQAVYDGGRKEIVCVNDIESNSEDSESESDSNNMNTNDLKQVQITDQFILNKFQHCQGLTLSDTSITILKDLYTSIQSNPKDLFLGYRHPQDIAIQIADCQIHPQTLQLMSFHSQPGQGNGDFNPFFGYGKANNNITKPISTKKSANSSGGHGQGVKGKAKGSLDAEFKVPDGQMDILSFFKPIELTDRTSKLQDMILNKENDSKSLNQTQTETQSQTNQNLNNQSNQLPSFLFNDNPDQNNQDDSENEQNSDNDSQYKDPKRRKVGKKSENDSSDNDKVINDQVTTANTIQNDLETSNPVIDVQNSMKTASTVELDSNLLSNFSFTDSDETAATSTRPTDLKFKVFDKGPASTNQKSNLGTQAKLGTSSLLSSSIFSDLGGKACGSQESPDFASFAFGGQDAASQSDDTTNFDLSNINVTSLLQDITNTNTKQPSSKAKAKAKPKNMADKGADSKKLKSHVKDTKASDKLKGNRDAEQKVNYKESATTTVTADTNSSDSSSNDSTALRTASSSSEGEVIDNSDDRRESEIQKNNESDKIQISAKSWSLLDSFAFLPS